MTKITKRDNYNSLRELVENTYMPNDVQDRLLAFIDHEIEQLDKRAASAKKYAKKTAKAEDALATEIDLFLHEQAEPVTIANIVAGLDENLNATAQKVSYRLTKMVEQGTVAKSQVTIKEDGKSRKINAYALVRDAE